MAIQKLISEGKISNSPITNQLAAISVGVNREGKVIADLNYEEDSSCETDMNLVMTRDGRFVEIQGTAEGQPFSMDQLQGILQAGNSSLEIVFKAQDDFLGSL